MGVGREVVRCMGRSDIRIKELGWAHPLGGTVDMVRIWEVMPMVLEVGYWRSRMIGMSSSVRGLPWNGLNMAKGSVRGPKPERQTTQALSHI